MIGRCHDDSLVGRSPGGHLAVSARLPKSHRREFSVMPAKRAPPGRRTDACGWPLDHLPIRVPQLLIVMWSLGHRTMPVRSSRDHPRCLLGLCCACVLLYVVLCCLCCYVYIIYWMILNNKNKILVMLLIYYFLSCIVLPCVYQKYYYWNKCCYVFSVLLALK